uniref:Uncharacterized protein n=1 Tax=Chromera velia CCMP2878 TaxID=1169474 RepID=A0A0G4GJS9_9ALVE|mmetsp:Transcript_4923/g.9849  ORF Transcript_4923/g.9849 Transcript_4923/m.9849 type:complete len:222 (+) Transcript_4923:196-861(+)|eukprot:Cvel_22196.t1-p1 / transcript=Cvel_22196.t1 / gene=Cvel_22196 / organism=Chromera_velia_CCMP2878 / gene_product=hypothetical protein / transcript_product=hypothetical protein / location=Cvel_scaffold2156:13240-14361(+) / protein_length=221 / sequence_SO=supercontig / SO=protein_coding / is_pseudo=false
MSGDRFFALQSGQQKAPFFEAMFSAGVELSSGSLDPDGNIELDLDPRAFDIVLTHLRSGVELTDDLLRAYPDPIFRAKLSQAMDFLGMDIPKVGDGSGTITFVRMRKRGYQDSRQTIPERFGSAENASSFGQYLRLALIDGCTVAKEVSRGDPEWDWFDLADDGYETVKFLKLRPPKNENAKYYKPGMALVEAEHYWISIHGCSSSYYRLTADIPGNRGEE